ncbi:MAG: hypothetical protein U0W24_15660 [Bacteroidales bacterium]
MKITKTEAERMDQVLRYLVENENARIKPKQLQDLLSVEFGDAEVIYHKILDYHNENREIIAIMNALNLAARPLVTKQFLDEGGFIKIYESQEIKSSEKLITGTVKPGFILRFEKSELALYVALLSLVISVVSILISLGIIKI